MKDAIGEDVFRIGEEFMASSKFVRLGTLGALLAGVWWVVMSLLSLATQPAPFLDGGRLPYLDVLFIAALLLTLVGYTGLHVLQGRRHGLIGRVGFFMGLIGSLLLMVDVTIYLLGIYTLRRLVFPWDLFGVLVGFLIFGIATLWARMLPWWCGLAIILQFPLAAFVGYFMGPISIYGGYSGPFGDYSGAIVLGAIWLALGYVLWTRGGTVSEHPSRGR
jgi:hypothetical protein